MGAPDSGMQAAEQASAETLLSAFKTIDASERRKHASVLNYWLSIRGDKEFPPLHDLDPLEISDAGPNSILLELISGGHDAEVRHIGEALRDEGRPERIIDAPSPSVLASIAKKLPIVAISRDFLAFEDEFATLEKATRCWVTLLPLSAGGAWVDYVYALVSLEADGAAKAPGEAAAPVEPPADEPVADAIEAAPEELTVEPLAGEPVGEAEEQVEESAEIAEPEPETDEPEAAPGIAEAEPMPLDLVEDDSVEDSARGRPGFSKLLDNIAGLTGFYGHGYKVDPDLPDVPQAEAETQFDAGADEPVEIDPIEEIAADGAADRAADEPAELADAVVTEEPDAETALEPNSEIVSEAADAAEQSDPALMLEGPLQTKLTQVRAMADEARQAKLRANAALYEGLSAAYDFALDAEDAPEEYLRLVEAEGLKIQLRSPMRPVVKLAFNGMCDDSTIRQLEAVLAWALDNELPRGSLADQIEAAGGIAPILSGEAKAD